MITASLPNGFPRFNTRLLALPASAGVLTKRRNQVGNVRLKQFTKKCGADTMITGMSRSSSIDWKWEQLPNSWQQWTTVDIICGDTVTLDKFVQNTNKWQVLIFDSHTPQASSFVMIKSRTKVWSRKQSWSSFGPELPKWLRRSNIAGDALWWWLLTHSSFEKNVLAALIRH